MSGAGAVSVTCPAKVNLFLEVLGRRPDGYHEIRTVFMAVALSDTVRATEAPSGVALAVSGADLPEGPENLAHAAATAFLDRFHVRRGVRLDLTKRVPIQAGLGGGSSDAAGTLLAMRKLFRPDLPLPELEPVARQLGSDVPFFLTKGTARGEGRGERIIPMGAAPPGWLVLFFPEFGLSTPAVYGEVRVPDQEDRRDPAGMIEALAAGDLGAIAPHLFNRLEEAAARADPRVADLRERLQGALGPDERLLLSGSGSAYFVLAGVYERAVNIARRLSAVGGGRPLVVSTHRTGGET